MCRINGEGRGKPATVELYSPANTSGGNESRITANWLGVKLCTLRVNVGTFFFKSFTR